MPKIIDTKEDTNIFFCFRTALQQLKAEQFKDKVLKP
jgi:hypothetical protein